MTEEFSGTDIDSNLNSLVQHAETWALNDDFDKSTTNILFSDELVDELTWEIVDLIFEKFKETKETLVKTDSDSFKSQFPKFDDDQITPLKTLEYPASSCSDSRRNSTRFCMRMHKVPEENSKEPSKHLNYLRKTRRQSDTPLTNRAFILRKQMSDERRRTLAPDDLRKVLH